MPTEQSIPSLFQSPLLPFVLIGLVMYFLVIKPEKLKQRQRKEMLKNLNKNDEVITTSGIHGTIVQVKDNSMVIRVDDNVKIEFDKEAVATVVKSKG